MLAAAYLTVNALACTPVRTVAPAHEPRTWTAYLGGGGLAPSADDSFASEPVRLWTAEVGRALAGPPAVGDSVIIAQATDARLVALTRATGKRLWSVRVDGLGATGPLLGHDAAYTATAKGQVSAVALRTGRFIWKRQVEPVVAPMALSADRMFVATASGRVYALNRDNGRIEWRRDLATALHAGFTLVGATLVLASGDSLYQMDPSGGEPIRTVAARGLGLNPPAVSGELMIFGSPDRFVAAFRAGNLEPVWRVAVDQPLLSSAVVARDTVFAVSMNGDLHAIPLADPGGIRTTPLGVAVRAAPAPVANGLLIATVGGEVLLVSPDVSHVAGPAPRWQVRVDGPLEHPPLVDNGMLIFSDGRGRMYAWN